MHNVASMGRKPLPHHIYVAIYNDHYSYRIQAFLVTHFGCGYPYYKWKFYLFNVQLKVGLIILKVLWLCMVTIMLSRGSLFGTVYIRWPLVLLAYGYYKEISTLLCLNKKNCLEHLWSRWNWCLYQLLSQKQLMRYNYNQVFIYSQK